MNKPPAPKAARAGKPRDLESRMQRTLMERIAASSNLDRRLRLIFAIPNGGSRAAFTNRKGIRISPEAIRMKAEGMKPGVPDLFLPVPIAALRVCPFSPMGDRNYVVNFHGLFLELKAGKNTPSPAQELWIEELRKEHYRVAVVWDSWETAFAVIESYLAGKEHPAFYE